MPDKNEKILFIMGGLVHYYNPILSRLNQLPGYELATLTPLKGNSSLGKGVHTESKNLDFQTFELEEKKGLFGKSFFKNFNQLMAQYKPDIIIAGWPYSLEILLNPFIKKKGRKIIHKDIPFNLPLYGDALQDYLNGKIIISEDYQHSNGKNPFKVLSFLLVTILRRIFLSSADAHVCYTRDAYRIFPSYGVKKEKIFIILNSPLTSKLIRAKNEALSQPNMLPINKYRLIHVGRLVKWKKVDLVIHAVKNLVHDFPEIEFLVVGDGPEKENLENLASELGLQNNIRFVGAVYDPVELAKYHEQSLFYVLGGIGGLSINEAMCFGKAVICSVADGTEKMLVHQDKNGYFFESDNLDDLTNKISDLLHNPEKAKLFGQESSRIIHEEVNEEKVIEGYIKALDWVSGKD